MVDEKITVEVDGRRLQVSNLDKILYPGTETTKGEILHYYAQVAPVLLRVIADRPVTRVRWPHGVGDNSFFEKNAPGGTPSWIRRVERGGVAYPLIDNVAGLTYFANLAALELHVPQWKFVKDEPMNPDRLVIDLDPGKGAGLPECAALALTVRDRLADVATGDVVPVTSGSKGMQLYAAIDGSRTSEEVRDWVKQLAQRLTKEQPENVVWKMTTSLRPGKVFVDWSQNTAAKTTIAPYSLRGRDRPTVAAPRTWDEIEDGSSLQQLTFDEVLDRLADLGDLWPLD
ncbi:bifunctional non-homologous end joining protein LigD [Branchiibius hedensis]|uniref:Bifunctional non-homologous end joining protein LigD n=1 Tax=Branchiibius hedensis TaxID=672460 RepID=A0A2Y8ZK95_9MICO|nr:non-homologous end-joining DNA ligase [Branchiibius hedensis]PWJ23992.1 bifunctional non-homologous end joining protein LigD [Branchiibius hedensis]SSA32810.1 bifunctional non-homologous end joining protein LigD [Branchiibius hedensis]